MIKKLLLSLCLLCTLAIVCSISSSAASYDNIIDFLSTIGIIDDNVQKDSVITRAQFVVYMNRVMNINVTSSKLDSPIFTDVSIEHWAYNDIIAAERIGLIQGGENGKFNPDMPIEMREALIIILRALNYENVMEITSQSKIISLANDFNLLNGINEPWHMPVSSEKIYILIYNSLNADMADMTSISRGGAVYQKNSGKTILTEYHEIYYNYGVVQADEYYALYGKKARRGSIVINDVQYSGTEKQIENLVGFNVKLYYKSNPLNDDKNIVYIYKYNNDEVLYSFEDISDFDGRTFTAFDKHNKKWQYIVDAKSTILLNQMLSSSTNEIKHELSSNAGNVKLIDNNNDGIYDVVILKSYYNMIVQSFDIETKTIIGTKNENIPLDKYARYVLRDYLGRNIKDADINADMLLTVFEPASTDCVLIIMTGQNALTDKVNVINASKNEIIGETGDKYVFSRSAIYNIDNVVLGESYQIYLDCFNQIAFMKSRNALMPIGYLVNAALKKGVDSKLELKIFDATGIMSYFEAIRNVTIRLSDGTKQKFSCNEALDLLTDEKGNVKRQIIQYFLTYDKQIKEIWLLSSKEELPFHSLRDDGVKSSMSFIYRDLNFDGKYVLTNDTIFFVVPSKQLHGLDDTSYKIGSKAMFTSGMTYPFKDRVNVTAVSNVAYGFITDVFVYEINYDMNPTIGETVTPLLLLSYAKAISDDGVDIYRLTAMNNDGQEVKHDYYDFDGKGLIDYSGREVSKGDIVRLIHDERGYLTKSTLESIYDCKNNKSIRYLVTTYVRYIPQVRVIPTKVEAKQGTYIKFLTKSGVSPDDASDSMEIANLAGSQVIIFDIATNKYSRATFNKVGIGDEFIMSTSYGKPKLIIYYQ